MSGDNTNEKDIVVEEFPVAVLNNVKKNLDLTTFANLYATQTTNNNNEIIIENNGTDEDQSILKGSNDTTMPIEEEEIVELEKGEEVLAEPQHVIAFNNISGQINEQVQKIISANAAFLDDKTKNTVTSAIGAFIEAEKANLVISSKDDKNKQAKAISNLQLVLDLLNEPSKKNIAKCYKTAQEQNQSSPLWLGLGAALTLAGLAVAVSAILLLPSLPVVVGLSLIALAATAGAALMAAGAASYMYYALKSTPLLRLVDAVVFAKKTETVDGKPNRFALFTPAAIVPTISTDAPTDALTM
ncbi:MAG: hypothetical protein WC785_04520 [Tatlockia sp.]|jgi:hypothetical protein